MKLCVTNHDRNTAAAMRRRKLRGFTLVEMMIVVVVLLFLIAATLGSIFAMQVSTTRMADYNSAMALAEAKINDVRAIYYNPPISPFLTASTFTTNYQGSIDLNQAGTSFLVSGSIAVKIQYCGTLGHLVTVTVTANNPRKPLTVSLQTVVNKYSGGEK